MKPLGQFFQGPKAAAGSRQPSSHGTAPTPKSHVVTPNESFSCGEHAKTRLLYKFSTNYQDAHRSPAAAPGFPCSKLKRLVTLGVIIDIFIPAIGPQTGMTESVVLMSHSGARSRT
jgi:hypothetical protein